MADHALATVSNPTSALTDFTFVVDLSTMPADWWTAVSSSDGTRGRVYKGDGSTRLAADWIDFDDTAETGLLRVLWSGSLATTGTQQLWIEPPVSGNDAVAADNTYGSDNAYDSSWVGYWPLDGDYNDRTSNGADGTASGTPTSTTGKVGGAYNLEAASSEYVSATLASEISNGQITVLAWGSPTANAVTLVGSDGNFEVFLRISSGNTQFGLNSFTSNDRVSGETTVGTAGTWQHFGGRYNGSNLDAFYNGASDGQVTPTGSWETLTLLRIGALWTGGFWDGPIDDVQIHSTGRHDDWIAHEYDQTSDQSTFYGTWSWETSGGTTFDVSASDEVSLSDTSAGVMTLPVAASDGVSMSDSPSGIVSMPVSAGDGVSLSDVPTGKLVISASVSDGYSFSDATTGPLIVAASIVDNVRVSDAIASTWTFGVETTDGLLLSDGATEGGVISVTVAEGVTFSDSATAIRRILAAVSDGAVFSETATTSATISAQIADGVTFSDVVSAALAIIATVADGVTLSDIAVDATFLPEGQVRITVSSAQASVTITSKQASATVARK